MSCIYCGANAHSSNHCRTFEEALERVKSQTDDAIKNALLELVRAYDNSPEDPQAIIENGNLINERLAALLSLGRQLRQTDTH